MKVWRNWTPGKNIRDGIFLQLACLERQKSCDVWIANNFYELWSFLFLDKRVKLR